MLIEKLVVTLEADVRQLRAALAQGNAALAGTEVAAGKTQARIGGIAKASAAGVPSINAFRGSLTSLVASTLKLPGPLANVTSLLGTLAFGSATTVAIVGGLAVIAGGYRLLTKDTREAAKAQEDLSERLDAISQKRTLGIAGPALPDVEAQEKVIARLEARVIRALRPSRAGRLNQGGKEEVVGWLQELVTERKRLFDAQAALQESLLEQTASGVEKELETAVAGLRAQEAARKEANARILADAEERLKKLNAIVGREARLAMAQIDLLGSRGWRDMGQQSLDRGYADRVGFGRAAAATNERMLGGAPATLTLSVNKFRDAVDGFRDGVKNFFSGFKDFKGIGTQVGAGLFSMGAEMLVSSIGNLIDGQSKLEKAMERNSQALTATGDFLRQRVEAAGFGGDTASQIQAAITNVLNRIAVGDLAQRRYGDPKIQAQFEQTEIFKALEASGVDVKQLREWAKAIGFDLSTLSVETLGAFGEALTKAGFAADEVAESFGEMLSNVPEGFKATLDYLRFRAADAVGAVSGAPAALAFAGAGASAMGASSRGVTLPNATFHVYGVQNVKALLAEIEDAALGKASRGGAVTFQPAYLRR